MQAVILAAGESSRFWPLNAKHKSLFKFFGKPLIEWTIESLRMAGAEEIIIAQSGHSISAHLKRKDVKFVSQKEPLGMGDALMQCEGLLGERFFLFHPYHYDAYQIMPGLLRGLKKADSVLLGKKTSRPQDYGIMKLSGGRVTEIVEKPKKRVGNVRVVGAYLLEGRILKYIKKAGASHYNFEDALNMYAKERRLGAVVTRSEVPSLKYPWDLLAGARLFMEHYVHKTPIRDDIITGHNVIVEGNVHIGRNVRIYENAVIRGPAYIGDNCVIGNNALIRGSIIESGCTIGANTEIARCVIGSGCSVHSGYFGDCVLSEGCKIGAGFISANVRLDRKAVHSHVKGERVNTRARSLGAIFGDDVRVGVGVRTMPGVLIGKGALIGPGEIVKENIADGGKVV